MFRHPENRLILSLVMTFSHSLPEWEDVNSSEFVITDCIAVRDYAAERNQGAAPVSFTILPWLTHTICPIVCGGLLGPITPFSSDYVAVRSGRTPNSDF